MSRHLPWQEATAWIDRDYEFTSAGSPCPGCAECGLEDVHDMDDPRYQTACMGDADFSWRACDWCRSTLGGTRESAHGFRKGDNKRDAAGRRNLYHWRVCTDCVLYAAGYTDRELGNEATGQERAS